VVLSAKANAMTAINRQKVDTEKQKTCDIRTAGRGGKPHFFDTGRCSVMNAPLAYEEPVLTIPMAYNAGVKALPPNSPGLRELFAHLAKAVDLDPTDQRKWTREFAVLMLMIHDRLQREQATLMRNLILRAERRDPISVEEFREALAGCSMSFVDESVWRAKLCPPGGMYPGQVNTEVLLDLLGGGSHARLVKSITVTETAFLIAVTEATTADYADRVERLRRLWQRRLHEMGDSMSGSLEYSDFKAVMSSVDPDLPLPVLRSLYSFAVDASRACVQGNEEHVPVLGSLKQAASGLYGGDLVTFKLLQHACMKLHLFLPGPHAEAPRVVLPAASAASPRPGGRGSLANVKTMSSGTNRTARVGTTRRARN